MIKITDELLDRVAKAIEEANCPHREGPYGLYDYTNYGHPTPHHVRDFRDYHSGTYGDCVFMTTDRDAARADYDRRTRHHIALNAIKAVLGVEE